MNKQRLIFLFLLISMPPNIYGFELATHGRLTEHAFLKSRLAQDSMLLTDLGLSNLNSLNPFGKIYYDASGTTVYERTANDFEKVSKRISNPDDAMTIKGWLMRGAIREDDLGYLLGIQVGPNPHDDPYGDIFRVFNHFYDPYYDRALSYVPGAKKNPDWAIGSSDVFSTPNTPETGRRNHFTIFDAREAIYRALTLWGKQADGSYASLDDGSWDNAKREQTRKTYWATTFRALGNVLQLNQDIAQPQHTHNEPLSCKTRFASAIDQGRTV